jgi:hypothetical protein
LKPEDDLPPVSAQADTRLKALSEGLQSFAPNKSTLPLIAIGSLITVLLFLIGKLPQRLEAHSEPYVAVFLIVFTFYGIAAYSSLQQPYTRKTLLIIIGFAVLFRLLAVLQPPSLSTDIWRYVWDGHIGSQGINPYRFPPSDPHLAPYHTDYWAGINHPTWVTMYPPLSQRIFTGIALLGGAGPMAYKVVFALVDLGCIALILLLLRRVGQPLHRVILYAWHPLVVMELSGSGHQDVLGIFFMLVAVALLRRKETVAQAFWGGLGAGLSFMAKGYLLPALPIFARQPLERISSKGDPSASKRLLTALGVLIFTVGFGLTVSALQLPYMGHGSQIQEGMRLYMHNRLRNAGVFAWTFYLLKPFIPDPRPLTWLLILSLLGLVVLRLLRRPWKDEAELLDKTNGAMGAFFLLSHTVYPWYATWLIPGLCLRYNAGWMLWSGLAALAYLNPLPQKNPWVPFVEYLPVLAALYWQQRRRSGRWVIGR